MPSGSALLARVGPLQGAHRPVFSEVGSSSQPSCSPRVVADYGPSWRAWSFGAHCRSRGSSSSHQSESLFGDRRRLSAGAGKGRQDRLADLHSGAEEDSRSSEIGPSDPLLKHSRPINLQEKAADPDHTEQFSMAQNQPAYKRATSLDRPLLEDLRKGEAIEIQDFASDRSSNKEADPLFKPVLRNVLVCCIASFLFGYHLGVVNGPLEYIAKDLGFAEDSLLKGAVVSSTLGAAFIGSVTGGSLADKVGRKRTFQLTAIPLLIGAAISATSTAVQQMILGRFVVGLGLGVSASAVPLYISEVAPTKFRGLLGSINQVAACIGILAALLLAQPLSSIAGWWRAMFWFATVPAVALAAGMGLAAESPRWLYKNGRQNEAEVTIGRMWGPWCVQSAMDGLKGAASPAGQPEVSFGELFSLRYRKVVLVGALMFALQQLSGINAVFYFSSSVFEKAGIKSQLLASAAVGVANLVAAVAALGMMDRLGRRKLLMYSFAGMSASLLLQVASMTLPSLMPYAGPLAVAGTIAYVVSFAVGAGPVPALLLPEIFPTRIRSKALAVAMATHWIFNFCIGLYFLEAVQLLGVPNVYMIFATVAAAAVAFTYVNVVETKGRSLEEIESVMCPATA